jgi:eukaryotic-like serine/threonine-protein kinase
MSDPQKLGKYEIRRRLGRGAMGIIYEGYDPFIERTVALKTIRKELLDQDQAQEMLTRFQHEAQAGGRLSHPNIVAIYDYGEDHDTAYIAMEFVEGIELKEMFAENTRFSLPNIVDIMSQLLSALNYSHRHGVVHRDIKPANIIIMADGQVKIADFGIARLESSNLTQTGSVLGTPNYMSPEQFMGQHVDGRSDLFSAGVILYQLLTGEKPFVGESSTTIMYQVLNNMPNAPSELNVQIPAAFDGIVHKALAKRPDDRFQTGQEFFDAIELAAEGGQFISDVESTITAINPAPPGTSAVESGLNPAPPAGAAKKLWIGAGAVAALGAIATIASLYTQRHAAPPALPAPQVRNNPISAVAAPPPMAAVTPSATTTPEVAEKAPKKDLQKKVKAAEKKPRAVTPASEPSHAPRTNPQSDKPPAKKKGIFGEELKPSQWRKDDGLL